MNTLERFLKYCKSCGQCKSDSDYEYSVYDCLDYWFLKEE